MAILLAKRIHAKDVQTKKEGDEVIVAGFAADAKEMGKIAFITLRDRSGTVQIVATPENKQFKDIGAIAKESVITLKGIVKASKLKSGAKELQLKEFEVVNPSQPNLPIDFSGKVPTNLDKRLDFRILDLRNPKVLAIFKIRSRVNMAIREFLIQEGFIEMQTPKIISAGAEGGATLFPVVYYNKKAFLSQSQQLYKQMMLAAGFEKVFEIGPTFRAEKSHTTRHLTEFTHFDFEMAYIDDEDDVLKVMERMFMYVMKQVEEKCKEEIALLGIKLDIPKFPFPRVTYKEGVEMLNAAGSKMKLGDDVGSEDEKKLGKLVQKKYGASAYFLTKFPTKVRAFYIMNEGEYCRGFDFMYRGLELSSGGQREHRYEVLKQQISGKGMNPDAFEFYLDAFKYGIPTHGGFGIGVDRMVQTITQLENVREAVLFPRDPERLEP
jgi:nondiscriminating aspartyl-tRNA synthetase